MRRIGYKLLTLTLILMLFVPIVAQEEEGTTNPLAGYTAGLNFGYPIVTGEYFSEGTGPVIGIVGNTPYGFALGPFNLGVGFGVEAVMMDAGTEIGLYGSINTTLYVTPYGPISYYGGVGLYGGMGLIGGLYYEYMVPNMPLVLKPYLRGVFVSSAAVDDAGDDAASYFVNIGVMALYDISTLF